MKNLHSQSQKNVRFIFRQACAGGNCAPEVKAHNLEALKKQEIGKIDVERDAIDAEIQKNAEKEQKLRARLAKRQSKRTTFPLIGKKTLSIKNQSILDHQDTLRYRKARLWEKRCAIEESRSENEVNTVIGKMSVEDAASKSFSKHGVFIETKHLLGDVDVRPKQHVGHSAKLEKDFVADVPENCEANVMGALGRFFHQKYIEARNGLSHVLTPDQYKVFGEECGPVVDLNSVSESKAVSPDMKEMEPVSFYRAKLDNLMLRVRDVAEKHDGITYKESKTGLSKTVRFEYEPEDMHALDEHGNRMSSIDKVIVLMEMNNDGTNKVSVTREFGADNPLGIDIDLRSHEETLKDTFVQGECEVKGSARYEFDSTLFDGKDDIGEQKVDINKNDQKLDDVIHMFENAFEGHHHNCDCIC